MPTQAAHSAFTEFINDNPSGVPKPKRFKAMRNSKTVLA